MWWIPMAAGALLGGLKEAFGSRNSIVDDQVNMVNKMYDQQLGYLADRQNRTMNTLGDRWMRSVGLMNNQYEMGQGAINAAEMAGRSGSAGMAGVELLKQKSINADRAAEQYYNLIENLKNQYNDLVQQAYMNKQNTLLGLMGQRTNKFSDILGGMLGDASRMSGLSEKLFSAL